MAFKLIGIELLYPPNCLKQSSLVYQTISSSSTCSNYPSGFIWIPNSSGVVFSWLNHLNTFGDFETVKLSEFWTTMSGIKISVMVHYSSLGSVLRTIRQTDKFQSFEYLSGFQIIIVIECLRWVYTFWMITNDIQPTKKRFCFFFQISRRETLSHLPRGSTYCPVCLVHSRP